MSIRAISIGSSSSGNSYIIQAGGKVILLDVGLAAKRINSALEGAGHAPEDVDAVLITHEHVDHVKSVRAVSRKCCNAVFYASRGTVEATGSFCYVPEERIRVVQAGEIVTLGNEPEEDSSVRIGVFALSHDASEPVGYTISCGSEKMSVVTDTGIITDEIYDAISDSGKLIFESNHDENLLMYGEYPYPVKMRIKSDHGHLSNRYAGEVLARILRDRASIQPGRRKSASGRTNNEASMDENNVGHRTVHENRTLDIMLAHLSFHNNAPYYARNTIEPILKENGFEEGVDYTLVVAARDEITIL